MTGHDIERYKGWRKECIRGGKTEESESRPITPATINREIAFIKACYNKARQWEKVSSNPAEFVRLYNEREQAKTRFLSADEKGRLLNVSSPELKRLLVMALNTGLRRGEILNLKWTDVEFTSGTLKIVKSKGGKPRYIPMHGDVREILQSLPRRGAFVFTDEAGNRLSYHGFIRTQFDIAVEKAMLREVTFHTLRHTFCSDMVAKGCDLVTLKEILGHTSLAMVLRYSHLAASHKSVAINLLPSLLKPVRTPGVVRELQKQA